MPSREPRRFAVAFILLAVLIDVVAFGIVGPVLPQLIMELMASNVSEAAFDFPYLQRDRIWLAK